MNRIKITIILTVSVILGALHYFINLESMIKSHIESYYTFPFLLCILAVVQFTFTIREPDEGSKITYTAAGFFFLILYCICRITISRIPCCSGG